MLQTHVWQPMKVIGYSHQREKLTLIMLICTLVSITTGYEVNL